MKWFKENKISTITSEDFSDLEDDNYNAYIESVDREGYIKKRFKIGKIKYLVCLIRCYNMLDRKANHYCEFWRLGPSVSSGHREAATVGTIYRQKS